MIQRGRGGREGERERKKSAIGERCEKCEIYALDSKGWFLTKKLGKQQQDEEQENLRAAETTAL